jgi:hypothetical protein
LRPSLQQRLPGAEGPPEGCSTAPRHAACGGPILALTILILFSGVPVLVPVRASPVPSVKKERKKTDKPRRGMADGGGGQGPHLHEQDFGRTIRGTGGPLLLLTTDTTGSQRGARCCARSAENSFLNPPAGPMPPFPPTPLWARACPLHSQRAAWPRPLIRPLSRPSTR